MNKNTPLVLLGALAGGAIGIAIFAGLAKNFGAYGFAIPGVLVGLGATIRRGAPLWVSIVCGLFGLIFGLGAIWKFLPYAADGGLGYFVGRLSLLPLPQKVLVGLGAGIAFWLPFRRRQK